MTEVIKDCLGIDVSEIDNSNTTYTLYMKEYYHKVIKFKNQQIKQSTLVTCPCGIEHNMTIEGKRKHRNTKEHRFYHKHGYPISEKKSKCQDWRGKYTCEVCDCQIQLWNKHNHNKTMKHIRNLESLNLKFF
jgi:hypothetical protein